MPGVKLLVLAFLIISIPRANQLPFQKTVAIHVNEKGEVMIDQAKYFTDDLAREVQQRLWRSYMTSGKMVQSIHLSFDVSVSEELKKEVLYNIKTAQEKTLTVLSLHKHKKRFENISSNKQEKIRKQFPVLFQTDFSPHSTQ
jgi:hypothetical protein